MNVLRCDPWPVSAAMGRYSKAAAGFTLVELVIVIVLIGILSVYAVARFSPDFTARQASEELIQAMRVTQEAALDNTAGSEPAVSIEADGIRFDIDGDGNWDPGSPGAATWALQKPDPSLKVSITPTGTVTFDGRGEPTCGGNLACSTGPAVINVTANDDTQTVTLEAVTGFAHR